MMFSVPRPENDDRRYRELAVSGHEVSVWSAWSTIPWIA